MDQSLIINYLRGDHLLSISSFKNLLVHLRKRVSAHTSHTFLSWRWRFKALRSTIYLHLGMIAGRRSSWSEPSTKTVDAFEFNRLPRTALVKECSHLRSHSTSILDLYK